jgi:hypothetical protein
MSEERGETPAPFRAHIYAPRSIVVKLVVLRIIASLDDITPDAILLAVGHAVGGLS